MGVCSSGLGTQGPGGVQHDAWVPALARGGGLLKGGSRRAPCFLGLTSSRKMQQKRHHCFWLPRPVSSHTTFLAKIVIIKMISTTKRRRELPSAGPTAMSMDSVVSHNGTVAGITTPVLQMSGEVK